MKSDQAILKGGRWQYWLDGKRVTQEVYERRYPPPKDDGVTMRASHAKWPVVSKLSLACDPSQVEEMRARNKAHGINVDYRADGAAIIPDEAAYKRLRRFEGVRDRDSYSE